MRRVSRWPGRGEVIDRVSPEDVAREQQRERGGRGERERKLKRDGICL
jgi:hypothetical protein